MEYPQDGHEFSNKSSMSRARSLMARFGFAYGLNRLIDLYHAALLQRQYSVITRTFPIEPNAKKRTELRLLVHKLLEFARYVSIDPYIVMYTD